VALPKDLDEIPEDQLLAELQRRAAQQAAGLCDYCGQNPKLTAPCRSPGRHFARGRSPQASAASPQLAALKSHVEQMKADVESLVADESEAAGARIGRLAAISEILRTINTIATV